MSTLSRNSNSQSSGSRLSQFPYAVWFAAAVLVALVVLWLLRHFFGSIRVEAGTR